MICDYCGEPYEPKASGRSQSRFCSSSCRLKNWRGTKIPEIHYTPNRFPPEMTYFERMIRCTPKATTSSKD